MHLAVACLCVLLLHLSPLLHLAQARTVNHNSPC
jgi:hypothetical protein